MIETWDRGRVAELEALLETSFADERLVVDEVESCCWDDPGLVLGLPDGDGAVSAVVREIAGLRLGWVRVLAVHPGARRLGHGRALLAEAEAWCWEQDAAQVRLGGSAPFYLWPGVDVRWTAALVLVEESGYRVEGAELNLSCPTTVRARSPEGVVVRRVVEDRDADSVLALAAECWPHWVAELDRGIEQGGAFGAWDDEEVLGFGCHSVNRAAWVGPMAVDLRRQRGGVGSAVLGELCRDLMVAGFSDAEIAWVGPVRFYVKAAGASVSRVFRTFVKDRPTSAGIP